MNGTVGEIRLFAGNFAPRTWAFCDGQLLPIAQYTALFSILGTIYGGDGRTTFALPDLRGRTAIGAGRAPGLNDIRQGQKGGTEETFLNTTHLPSHTHTSSGTASGSLKAYADVGSTPDPTNNYLAEAPGSGSDQTNYALGNKWTPPNDKYMADIDTTAISGTTGGSGDSMSNIQPTIGTRFVICLQGIYPSRS